MAKKNSTRCVKRGAQSSFFLPIELSELYGGVCIVSVKTVILCTPHAVLTHTVPYRFRPVDTFIPGLDQSSVDTSTEKSLGQIEKKLSYQKWYAGHFHIDREVENCRIMYKQVALFMQDRDLGFEMF